VFELAKVKGIFEDALENVAQGVVIADFYLPYLCCSDCPPVQFVVNIPPPKITFSLNKYDYCGEDQEKYYFLTSPSGGKITTVDAQKDTFVDNGDGTFTFLPAKAVIAPDQAKVSISYTYMAEGLAQTITVTVYRKPAVKIMVTPDPNNPRKFTFAFDSPAMITGVTWNFGDNSPVSHDIAPPAYTYKSGGEFTVSAEVTNGVCSAKPESVIVKAGDPEPVKVTIGTDQICQDVDKLEFSITPPGGTLSGEKFEESPQGSGKYIFHPSNVDMQGKSQRTITFNYVSLQNETASFTITVYAKPAGTSNVDQGGLLRAVAAFNQLKNASQVVVYFGDNTKEEIYPVANLTSFVTPAHLYAKGDTYTIKMRLENGTCVTVLEERKITVVGRTLLEMKCRPLEDPMPGFEALQPDIKKNKAAFKGYPLEDVGKFIELLSGALDVSGNVELKFFDKDPRMIPDWITLLPLTETSTSVSVRMLAGFNNVLLYRACQRKEDVDDVLLALFEALQEKLKAITILNDDDKLVLNAILNNLQKELENLAQNGEDQIKLVYVRILKALIKLVKTLLK
ncbi:MAG TPA: hypothetical protein VIN08_15840, partial [Ohtaekwangia sp.]|uniref:PKD domain-containing protein n=1 Tax=Ohtaekwangia sp. TaxID=2066019 RepID=UPI002F92DF1A